MSYKNKVLRGSSFLILASAGDWRFFTVTKCKKCSHDSRLTVEESTSCNNQPFLLAFLARKKSKLSREYLLPFYISESRDGKWQHFFPFIVNAEFLQVMSVKF